MYLYAHPSPIYPAPFSMAIISNFRATTNRTPSLFFDVFSKIRCSRHTPLLMANNSALAIIGVGDVTERTRAGERKEGMRVEELGYECERVSLYVLSCSHRCSSPVR